MARLTGLMFGVLATILFSSTVVGNDRATWVGTWGTIRYRVRVSLRGSQIRLRFSNEYNDSPLSLAAVTVGLAGKGLDALPGSLKRVTFDGKLAVIVPARAPALAATVCCNRCRCLA